MNTYVMEAKENYDPTRAAEADGAGFPTPVHANQFLMGLGYDLTHRELAWQIIIENSGTNDSGHTLWDGAVSIAASSSISAGTQWNYWTARKNIDTGVVTFYDAYSAAQTVPSGVGGNQVSTFTFAAGTGYRNGSFNVWFTGGTGHFFKATVVFSGHSAASVTPIQGGWGFTAGDVLIPTADMADIIGAGTGFSVTVSTVAGTGSDGSWRRFVTDTASTQQYPTLTDPRNGDAWVHQESCDLYVFRRADSYALAISPLLPIGDINNPVIPMGMETDWVYASEISEFSLPGVANLYLVPRVNQTAEIAADAKLAFATFPFPSGWISSGDPQKFFRSAVDDDGNMWVFACNRLGTLDFTLYKFTKPSAFVYPTPPVDGGFTDVTPWLSTTGPNAPAVGANAVATRGPGRMAVMFTPGRRYLVLMSTTYSDDFPPTFPDQDTTITYTMYDTQTGAWSSHLVGQGSMTAAFVPTTDPGDTAFVLDGQVNITNQYLDADNFYDDADYAYRWFFFKIYDFSSGSVHYGDQRYVLVKLTWDVGLGAPTVSQVVDEQGWDDAYTTYGGTTANGRVVYGSIYNEGNGTLGANIFDMGFDVGLYDPTTNAFWWGGMTSDDGANDNMFYLDSAFTGRTANSAQPPLLRLSFGAEPPPPGSARRSAKVSLFYGKVPVGS